MKKDKKTSYPVVVLYSPPPDMELDLVAANMVYLACEKQAVLKCMFRGLALMTATPTTDVNEVIASFKASDARLRKAFTKLARLDGLITRDEKYILALNILQGFTLTGGAWPHDLFKLRIEQSTPIVALSVGGENMGVAKSAGRRRSAKPLAKSAVKGTSNGHCHTGKID